PDHDRLTLGAVGLPAFATFSDGGGTGHFHFAPGLGDRGNYVITVHAVDDGKGGSTAPLAADASFVLTVEVPNAPPRLTPLAPRVAVVGQSLQIGLAATDLDQTPLTFAVQGLPAGATLTPSSVYGRATVTWTPTAADVGRYSVLVTVTDDGNGDAAKALGD